MRANDKANALAELLGYEFSSYSNNVALLRFESCSHETQYTGLRQVINKLEKRIFELESQLRKKPKRRTKL